MASSFDLQQLQQQSAGNPLSLSSDSGSVSSTLTPRFEGDVTVRGPQGETITVPVREVTDALLKEVEALRSELVAVRQAKEPDLRGNMLTYIQALPDSDMSKLTSDMGQDVMDAIQV
jgi:hypothetical protein